MERWIRLNILCQVLVFLVVSGLSLTLLSDVYAGGRRPDPTQTEIKEKGKAGKEKGVIRWESLSPAQQEYFEKIAKERAQQANQTGQEYWESLTPEQQQEAAEMARERGMKGRERWKERPE